MMLDTFWSRTILPTATLNLHHLCVAMVCEQKPPVRGVGHMAVLRMEGSMSGTLKELLKTLIKM